MPKTKYTYNPDRREWYTLVYDGTLTPSGAKHRKRITSKKSSRDLENKVAAFKAELENKGAVNLSNITFGEYAKQWFESSKVTKEYNTQRSYKITLESCFDDINDIPLQQITHSHFQACINNKQEHPRTCQLINLTFKQIIRSAVRDHYLPNTALIDITEDISLPKYYKPQKRPLNDLEKEALFKSEFVDQKRQTFVMILYYCGLRKSEALALTTDDFDFDKKTVNISKVVVYDKNSPFIKPYPKSDNGVRSVPLPEACISIIKPYVESCEGFIFKGQNKPLMTAYAYRRMWESIVCSMNMALGYRPHKRDRGEKPIQGLTAHIFRHNYCTELCYQIPMISTKKVAQLLGDTEQMVLDVYSHIKDDKEDVTGALNNIFN